MADGVPRVTVVSQDTKSDFNGFLKALDVWIEKPHVVNRRLTGALVIGRFSFESFTGKDMERFLLDETKRLLRESHAKTVAYEGLRHAEIEKDIHIKDESHGKEHLSGPVESEEVQPGSIVLRRLLPRQLDRKDTMLELIILEKRKGRVSFYPLTSSDFLEDNSHVCCDWLNKHKSYCLLYEKNPECTKEQNARVLLQVMDNEISNESNRDGVLCPTVQWLQDYLLPKICKWAEEIQPDEKISKGSLRHVPLDQYTMVYYRLKQQYGDKLVKMWPERTDPHKFVYEDIAIASYLLILWEEERKTLSLKQKQSFVDLGCGNGLLVYILSEEGHPGTGIDVRHRKIWDLYGRNTDLQERAVDPTLPGLFPDTNWLIGNHSDELTPWIPVMAARSSYTTRYFVLPCCLFDFNCKFVRKNNKVTQYRGYLDFVQDVGETCGFHVEEDSLRIPSTKRICQIGRVRTYPEDTQLQREALIKDMILRRGCNLNAGNIPETLVPTSIKQTSYNGLSEHHAEEKSPWERTPQTDNQLQGKGFQQHSATPVITDNTKRETISTQTPVSGCNSNASSCQLSASTFQPRPSQELMRNCTTLDQSLKDFIVNTVARRLLGLPLNGDKVISSDTGVEVITSSPASSSVTCTSSWRKGGQMELPEVAKLFDKSTLLQLKNECGGLQTLLRNHYYIFKVVGGVVEIRDWTQETPGPRAKKGDLARKQRRSQALWKTCLCWFDLKHPDGCPVTLEKCPFAHGAEDLRERPSKEYLSNL